VHQKALHSYSTDFNVQSFLYWERTNNIPRYKITSIRISLKAKGMIDCIANTLSIDQWSRESESSLNSGNLYFSMQVPFMLLRNVIKILRDNELSWIWSYYNLLVIRSIFSLRNLHRKEIPRVLRFSALNFLLSQVNGPYSYSSEFGFPPSKRFWCKYNNLFTCKKIHASIPLLRQLRCFWYIVI